MGFIIKFLGILANLSISVIRIRNMKKYIFYFEKTKILLHLTRIQFISTFERLQHPSKSASVSVLQYGAWGCGFTEGSSRMIL